MLGAQELLCVGQLAFLQPNYFIMFLCSHFKITNAKVITSIYNKLSIYLNRYEVIISDYINIIDHDYYNLNSPNNVTTQYTSCIPILTFHWTPCLPAGNMQQSGEGTGHRAAWRGSQHHRSYCTTLQALPRSQESGKV